MLAATLLCGSVSALAATAGAQTGQPASSSTPPPSSEAATTSTTTTTVVGPDPLLSARPTGGPPISPWVALPGRTLAEDGRDDAGKIILISPDLDSVPLENPDVAALLPGIDDLNRQLATGQKRMTDTQSRLERLRAEQAAIQPKIPELERRAVTAAAAKSRIESGTKLLAAAVMVNADLPQRLLDPRLALAQIVAGQRRIVLTQVAARSQLNRRGILDAEILAASAELKKDQARLEELTADIASAETELASATTDTQGVLPRIVELRDRLAKARRTGVVTGTEFDAVTLDAYWRAAQKMNALDPTCHISWEALAGIGKVESDHGRYYGGSVDTEGNYTTAIIGPQLNGAGNFAAVADTDRGILDGDPVWDRAVGPMQFIPSTWALFAQDQTADGIADPQNLYDTSLTTAAYLCRFGPGLDTEVGLAGAYYRYNASSFYVSEVMKWARTYQQLNLIHTPGVALLPAGATVPSIPTEPGNSAAARPTLPPRQAGDTVPTAVPTIPGTTASTVPSGTLPAESTTLPDSTSTTTEAPTTAPDTQPTTTDPPPESTTSPP